jgi:mono/diheme cytochrome c family protein
MVKNGVTTPRHAEGFQSRPPNTGGNMKQSEHSLRAFIRLLAMILILPATQNSLSTASQATPSPLPPAPAASQPRLATISSADRSALVEADWLEALVPPVTTQTDALGACDGVKNGTYGFHTGHQPNPWWQIDLLEPQSMARIVIYNRLDYAPGLHNADHLQIFTSEDGQNWSLLHDNQGRHFGGVSGAAPLTLTYPKGALQSRFLRLQLPSDQPIFFHLDEVEIYGQDAPEHNIALGKPADQSSLSPWSTPKRRPGIEEYPTLPAIQRARRLADDLHASGVDTIPFLEALDAAETRVNALSSDAGSAKHRALYLETRRIIRRLVLANPLLDFTRLLFVKRFCQETYPDVCLNHMPWVSRPGGDLCILANPFAPADQDQDIQSILNGALGPGHVHGFDLSFDGRRIVFGYARARSENPPEGWLDRRTNFDLRRKEEPIHIFEIGVDGGNLRQLTDGEWSDLDPTYAPNGDIVFVSERCGTSLQCNEYDKDETSCNLYVMRPDGGGIRRLSVSKDGDYLPHTLDDGTIGYTRWEYHERSFAYIQSLWTVRPDGTGADAVFKQHFPNPWAVEDARSIPNSPLLAAVAAGHHTLPAGPLIIIDPTTGINNPGGIHIVTPGLFPPEGGMAGVPVPGGGIPDSRGYYATPWPLSEKYFLVAYAYGSRPIGTPAAEVDPTGYALYLVDVFGNKELIVRDPEISCFGPVPLRPRPRPPILQNMVDLTADYATCAVVDITEGCEGIAPEEVGFLRIAEPIGWPYDNQYGGHRYVEDHHVQQPSGEPAIPQENWTPIRVLGDVPVSPDGSATFQVPKDTAVYFQLLDHERRELRRMRSFISFQPGEIRACVGCHESRCVTTRPEQAEYSQALARPPAPMFPAPWGDRPISFLRDVQPVLDRHCVRCHTGLDPAAGFDFSGGLTAHDLAVAGYGYNRAYTTILTNGLVSQSPARMQDAEITQPHAYGARQSRLMHALEMEHHKKAFQLTPEERLHLSIWIDANAPYHDRFVNKRAEEPAYSLPADQTLRQSLLEIHEKRCGNCHGAEGVTRLDWIDIHHPEESLFLTAPMSGNGERGCEKPTYANPSDPDYQKVRSIVEAAVAKARQNPRRDVQSISFTP